MERKLKALTVVVMLGLAGLTGGCASTQAQVGEGVDGRLLVAPLLPDYKQEVSLARLNEALGSMELTEEQVARIFYERGALYDNLGLRLLARLDFHQALKLRPNIADAYNYLGIYYTQEGDFDNAYESFDAVLELEPEYDYAFLNRGIALYYGERNDLALADMEAFLRRNPADGYRVLWYYLVDAKADKEGALKRLETNRKALSQDEWATKLVDFYLGKAKAVDIFEQAKQGLNQPRQYSERLCEAYFYLGKAEEAAGNPEQAANYFRLALATNIYDFVEHRYARVELSRLAKDLSPEPAAKP